jgi:hypothetical protein
MQKNGDEKNLLGNSKQQSDEVRRPAPEQPAGPARAGKARADKARAGKARAGAAFAARTDGGFDQTPGPLFTERARYQSDAKMAIVKGLGTFRG